jgi:predicted ATPase with chaperone activity
MKQYDMTNEPHDHTIPSDFMVLASMNPCPCRH